MCFELYWHEHSTVVFFYNALQKFFFYSGFKNILVTFDHSMLLGLAPDL